MDSIRASSGSPKPTGVIGGVSTTSTTSTTLSSAASGLMSPGGGGAASPAVAATPIMTPEESTKTFSVLLSKGYDSHSQKVHSVAWNCTGKKLASGSVDTTARVFQIDPHHQGKDIEFRGHTASVEQLCWDPLNQDILATASEDRTVRIWDARSGKCCNTIDTAGENINITWSPDGKFIAVGNKNDVITILDVKTWKPMKTFEFNFQVNEMAWHPRGDLFFLTTSLNTIEIVRFPEFVHHRTIPAHTGVNYAIRFDPQEKYFAVGSADALVSLWELSEWACVRTFPGLTCPVRTLGFSHDGQFIASGSEDEYIDISHVESGFTVHKIPTEVAPINSLAWSPKQLLLAYAGDKVKHGSALYIFGFKS
ncbi:THO complex subunit 3 [Pelomyxa schiedti]|nr:THO complex subunit 3 [Pelomyxa schiedti]